MDPVVTAIVLASAFMHALWNALVKVDGDRLMAMAVIMGLTAALSPVLIVLSPPIAAESWKYLVLSAALNNLYFFLLIESYRVGDLSHAYPLARGSAPLLVALGSAIFAGERLGPGGIAGVLLVSAGIMSLVAGSRFDPRIRRRAIGYPLATGATIAAYTVVDGIGVRLSGSPVGYIGWLFALFAFPIVLVAIVSRGTEAIDFLRTRWRSAGLAALFNFGSYGARHLRPEPRCDGARLRAAGNQCDHRCPHRCGSAQGTVRTNSNRRCVPGRGRGGHDSSGRMIPGHIPGSRGSGALALAGPANESPDRHSFTARRSGHGAWRSPI